MDEQIKKRIKETEALKKHLGFLPQSSLAHKDEVAIDLQRLALLIDPLASTKIYSHKKIVGPILTYMRIGLLRALYFLFKFDVSRIIELHQNVWLMAQQLQEQQKDIESLRAELQQMKKRHES
jgi:hypothetical protein